jgi:hypothetical protein
LWKAQQLRKRLDVVETNQTRKNPINTLTTVKKTIYVIYQLDEQWKELRPLSACKEKVGKYNGIKKTTTESRIQEMSKESYKYGVM